MLRCTSAQLVFQEVPDEISLAIEVTGCPRDCPGCHSPELRDPDGGSPLTIPLMDTLLQQHGFWISCVCFMGGDHAPEELTALLEFVQERGYKTALYTGAGLMDLTYEVVSHLDYLKYGAYDAALGGLTSPGTNQRMIQKNGNAWTDITSKFQRR